MTHSSTDPYGYEGLDVYTFGVNYDNVKGLQIDAPTTYDASHPHLEGIDGVTGIPLNAVQVVSVKIVPIEGNSDQ